MEDPDPTKQVPMKKLSKHPEIQACLVVAVFLLCFGITAQEMQTTAQSTVKTTGDANLEWGPCPEFMPEGCDIAVLNGDPTKENVDVFFRVPANSVVPNHWHTSAERMVLVSGEMEVQYEGEEARILEQGSYAYGPAEKPHTAKCGDNGPCILFIAFEQPLDAYAVETKD